MCTISERLIAVFAAAIAVVVGGCNGTSDAGGSGGTTPTMESATGIWGGADSSTGQSITGFVDSSGLGVFIRGDGVQFVGSVQVSGSTVAATVIGYTSFPSTFSDGSTSGLGTLNGTVQSDNSLTLTLAFTTVNGTLMPGSWTLTFNTLTNSGSSLQAITANYTDTAGASVVTISGSGTISGQNSANSCVVNGTVTIINSTYDIYQVSLTYENCKGTYAPLNGVEFTGLAVLNPNTSPQQLTIALSGANSSGKFSLVLNLQGS